MYINPQQLTPSQQNRDTVVTEASTIGLRPGQWPQMLIADGVRYFRWQMDRDNEGELRMVRYRAPGGKIIQVFND